MVLCIGKRKKNPIYKRRAGQVKLGGFLVVCWVILPCESSILRTPAMTVEPFIIEMTFSVCHMQQTAGSNRQEMMSPKHQLPEGDGLSP